jgi:hypothetical protein
MRNTISELQEAYREHEDYLPFLEAVKDYRTETPADVDEVLNKLNDEYPDVWRRQDVVVCMKELDELGLGKFIKGAKGKQSRIEWLVPPRAIYNAVMEQPAELEHLMDDLPAKGRDATDPQFAGKAVWSLEDLQTLLSGLTGVHSQELKIFLTLPEARAILSKSQGVAEEDVSIHVRV